MACTVHCTTQFWQIESQNALTACEPSEKKTSFKAHLIPGNMLVKYFQPEKFHHIDSRWKMHMDKDR